MRKTAAKNFGVKTKRAGILMLVPVLLLGTYFWWRPHKAHAQTDTFTVSGTWNVPSGVTSAVFEAWGGGGAGGASGTSNAGGGGGAGGQYAKKTLTGLVTNDAYTVTVATAVTGVNNNGTQGNASSVVSPSSVTIVNANGGKGGCEDPIVIGCTTAGAGGTGNTTGGIGDVVNAGGNGASELAGVYSGGGGGGAGSGGSGGNSTGNGTTCPGGTGTSSNGGNGGDGILGLKSAGNAGSNYGGGGSGAYKTSGGTQIGGNGSAGLVTVTYTVANSPPATPSLSSPIFSATDVALSPQFLLKTTDADSDYLDYEIQVCSTNNCSSVVRTVCQVSDASTGCTGSQTGWSGQDANIGRAYAGGTTLAGSTMAKYTYQPSALSAGTQYWWRGWAIDPGGSNTYSSATSIQSFTTSSPPSIPTLTSPSSGATGVSVTPTFSFSDTDPNSDDIQFTINLFQSDCTTAVTTYDMSGQTGWSPAFDGSGQTFNSYLSGTAGSGVSFVPSSALTAGTTYCWSVSALDPQGSNTSTTSGTQLFTTAGGGGGSQVNIGGGTNITGGTTIQ